MLLAKLVRPESRPAFREMLRSPYQEVRNRGARGLRALGESADDPPPSRSVSFRFLVNGRPAVNRWAGWRLEDADGGGESSGERMDAAGVLSLERDAFVDPRHRLASLHFQSRSVEKASDEWFDVTVAPPADLDALTTVSIRTGALTVVIPSELLEGTDSKPTIELFAAGEADDEAGETRSSASAELPVASARMVFPHLQHGRYEVWLRRGPSVYVSAAAEVGDRPATTTFGLEPLYSMPEVDPDERAASPTNQPL